MNGIFSNQFGRQHLGASSTLMSHPLEPHAVAFFCTLTRFRVSSRRQERTAGGGVRVRTCILLFCVIGRVLMALMLKLAASLWPGQEWLLQAVKERGREKFNGLIGEYIRNRIRIRFLAIK